MIKTPYFWYNSVRAPFWLRPLSSIYIGLRRLHVAVTCPKPSPLPTICVGNITAGGGGKTPTVRALAALIHDDALFILTRGYGGILSGPVRVTPTHTTTEIGDEAKLLAISAPTVMARHRLAGAHFIHQHGGKIILMDDGLQNRSLAAHLNILVVDGTVGFGNGACLPAGPLREPLADLSPRLHAAIIIGDDLHNIRAQFPLAMPVFTARQTYGTTHIDPTQRFFAFAGLARPEKFFMALQTLGLNVVATHALPDHDPYTPATIDRLLQMAKAYQARLITTAKDAIKWPRSYIEDNTITVLPMEITFDDAPGLLDLIHRKIEAL